MQFLHNGLCWLYSHEFAFQTFLGRYHVAPRGVHGFKWQQQQHSLAVHSLAGNGTALAGPHASVTQQGVKTDAGRILDTALQDEVQKSYLAVGTSPLRLVLGSLLPGRSQDTPPLLASDASVLKRVCLSLKCI